MNASTLPLSGSVHPPGETVRSFNPSERVAAVGPQIAAALTAAVLACNPGGAHEKEHIEKQWRTMQRVELLRLGAKSVRFTTARLFVVDATRPFACTRIAAGSFATAPLCHP